MIRVRRRLSPLILILIGIFLGWLYWSSNRPQPSPSEDSTLNTPAEVTVTPFDTPLGESVTVTPSTLFGIAQIEDAQVLIPKLGIGSRVVQVYLANGSWDISQLGMNIGHLQGTGWLDKPSNIVLSGHVEMADGRAGIFANLKELVIGDAIIMVWRGQNTRYMVKEIRTTSETDLTPLNPTDTPYLTLITCGAYNFLTNTYQERLIVIAEKVEGV